MIAPAAIVVIVALNTWSLRATRLPVAYLDDSAVHEQMVRFATQSFDAGRSPLSAWYPYLNLGSPQFLHYQSLGAMTVGLIGTLVGADIAFRWSLLLLLGCWPAVVYFSARIFGLGRWPAVAAAAVSPLIGSVPAAGYEPDAYVWVGYGLWAQLCGSWALPFAWATTWRAMTDRRFVLPAGLTVAATITLHYETGYLALMAVGLLPFVVPTRLGARLLRAAAVLLVAVLAAAWTLLPLLTYARWAAINQALEGTPLENGYGAHQVLTWLATGGVFDASSRPVVTVAVLAGALTTAWQWRQGPVGRALVVLGAASAILCFGRTTFGDLTDVVPASHDLFFRRFMMGLQLAGVYLAGSGVVAVLRLLRAGSRRFLTGQGGRARGGLHPPAVTVAAGSALLALAAWPAVHSASHLAVRNARAISIQRSQQRRAGAQIAPLLAYVHTHGGGRVYAGSPTNWGNYFDVGAVQVYKYLASEDIDEVGFTLRTAALMSQPEYQFDDSNPADYSLFGIRYLVLPAEMRSPVPASRLLASGPYALWEIPGNGYVSVVDTIGHIQADRSNVGTRSIAYLHSDLFAEHLGLTVAWGRARAAPATAPGASRVGGVTAPGSVEHTRADLAAGRLVTTVRTSRRAVVVLSASYDPGWRATVDGRPVPTEVLAPAVVGVVVPPGRHQVAFSYHGYPHYALTLLLLVVAVVGGALTSSVGMQRRRVSKTGGSRPARSDRASLTEHAGPVRVG